MKVIVFLSLWAFAWSVPLRGSVFQPTNWWGLQGSGQGTNPLWQQENLVLEKGLGQQNFQTQQITELLNQGIRQNVLLQPQGINTWQQDTQRNVVQQVVQRIVEHIEEKKQTLIQTAIEQLQQQLQQLERFNVVQLQSVSKQTQQVEIIAAIQQLQQIQGLVSRQGPQSLLVQTLEVAIESQLVINTVENQQAIREIVNTPVQTTEVFQVMVQKLIDQITIEDIQLEITRQEKIVQQLQQQQQFINRQRQQTQIERLIVQQQSQSQQLIQQLQLVQQNLQQQEQQLVQQQLVRQLVIRQLQQVLIGLENELQQDILNGQIKEQVSQVQVPWSQVGSLQVGNIWNQLPQSQLANLLTSGPRGLRIGTNTYRPVISGDQVSIFDLSQ